MPAIYESVWTKVGLLVELYTNPPSDLYNSIMLLHNSNSKSEALGPKSTGCTVYYPRGGVWEIRIDRRHFGSYRSPGGSSGTGLSRKRS